MTCATLNMRMQVPVSYAVSLSLDAFPSVGELGHMVDPFFVFYRISVLFSLTAIPICVPTTTEFGYTTSAAFVIL